MRDTVRIARYLRLAALVALLAATGLGLSACESSHHPQGDTAASALGGWR